MQSAAQRMQYEKQISELKEELEHYKAREHNSGVHGLLEEIAAEKKQLAMADAQLEGTRLRVSGLKRFRVLGFRVT